MPDILPETVTVPRACFNPRARNESCPTEVVTGRDGVHRVSILEHEMNRARLRYRARKISAFIVSILEHEMNRARQILAVHKPDWHGVSILEHEMNRARPGTPR